jgi:hypothetical protein
MRSTEHVNSGDWSDMAHWWGVSLIPLGAGVACLLHALVMWWIGRNKATQS